MVMNANLGVGVMAASLRQSLFIPEDTREPCPMAALQNVAFWPVSDRSNGGRFYGLDSTRRFAPKCQGVIHLDAQLPDPLSVASYPIHRLAGQRRDCSVTR